jgi:hypothetical protein
VQAREDFGSLKEATQMITQTNLTLYTIYLPLNHNNGKPLLVSRLRWARDEIARFVGGCTLLPPGDGLWIADGGQVYLDRVLPILVVASANPETEWFFRRLAGELAVLLKQHEIFIHRTPVSVVDALNLAAPEPTQSPRRCVLTAAGHTA